MLTHAQDTCETSCGRFLLTYSIWYLKVITGSSSHTVLTHKEWTEPGMKRSGISLYL